MAIIKEHKTIEELGKERNIHPSQVNQLEAKAIVVTGSDLENYTLSDWDNLILNKKEIVFARISPQQKYLIVKNLQRHEEIVAVTGDGVNDAIALKQASNYFNFVLFYLLKDIGVAMGEGNDVAKEAADIIFMDDNFCSLINGI